MKNESNSQCQLMQLHIDAWLDDELEDGRRQEFDRHVAACAACRSELDYARQLHQAVMTLPALDCSEAALEPVQRLLHHQARPARESGAHWWDVLREAFRLAPGHVRYATAGLAMAIVAGVVGFNLPSNDTAIPVVSLATQESAAPAAAEYSPEQIRQAMADLDLALDYLENVSERTGILVRDRYVLQQLDESINASFRTREDQPRSGQDGRQDGPI